MQLDPQALRAVLISQRDAATWYASARRMVEQADPEQTAHGRSYCLDFAAQDQRIAAKLSLADRTFRGLEG
jgi:hypothetical protein